MLSQRYPQTKLADALIPLTEFQPHPTIHQRDPWQNLRPSLRQESITAGESLLNYEWPSLPATLFLQYARHGNRRNYEMRHFARRGAMNNLVLAECMEGKGRFLDDIVNGIWAICEESYWGVPAHIRVQQAGNTLPDSTEPTVDLFAAETAATLAWTHYLLGDQIDTVSALVRPRIERDIQHRLLDVLLERNDFHWMGFQRGERERRVNNWNPWICSNWLASTLLIERDETRRQQSILKAMRMVDNFIDPYPQDGGCDEGPSYWGRAGASLFDCLEILHSATNGVVDVYDHPLIQEIGRFIHRVQIADDYYINFADAPAIVKPDATIIYLYGKRIDDPEMMALGASLAGEKPATTAQADPIKKRGVPPGFARALRTIFASDELLSDANANAQPPLPPRRVAARYRGDGHARQRRFD